MKNQLILGIEEKFYGKRRYNLNIYDVWSPNKNKSSKLEKYKGDYIVTKKGYLFRGYSNGTISKRGFLHSNGYTTLQDENNNVFYVIKQLGRLRLINSLMIHEKIRYNAAPRPAFV